jgi:hypothetical protein
VSSLSWPPKGPDVNHICAYCSVSIFNAARCLIGCHTVMAAGRPGCRQYANSFINSYIINYKQLNLIGG